MLPTSAARDGHALCVGGVVAVITALAREAGPLEMPHLPGTAHTLGGRGRHQTVECGNAIRLERLQSPAERVIMAMRGVDHHGRQRARGRFGLETPRHQLEVLVHPAEAGEAPRVHGIARGDEPPFWRVSGGTVHDLTKAEGLAPTRDKAQMVKDVTPIRGWHGILLSRGDLIGPSKFRNWRRVLRNVGYSATELELWLHLPQASALNLARHQRGEALAASAPRDAVAVNAVEGEDVTKPDDPQNGP